MNPPTEEGSIIEWQQVDGTRNVAVLDLEGWWVTGETQPFIFPKLGIREYIVVRIGPAK